MQIRKRMDQIEKRFIATGGKKQVVIILNGKSNEHALDEFKKEAYVHPGDEIVYSRLNLGEC